MAQTRFCAGLPDLVSDHRQDGRAVHSLGFIFPEDRADAKRFLFLNKGRQRVCRAQRNPIMRFRAGESGENRSLRGLWRAI